MGTGNLFCHSTRFYSVKEMLRLLLATTMHKICGGLLGSMSTLYSFRVTERQVNGLPSLNLLNHCPPHPYRVPSIKPPPQKTTTPPRSSPLQHRGQLERIGLRDAFLARRFPSHTNDCRNSKSYLLPGNIGHRSCYFLGYQCACRPNKPSMNREWCSSRTCTGIHEIPPSRETLKQIAQGMKSKSCSCQRV